jgi:hypothetical protein
MNLRALAAADPDTPMRQRNCGAVPIGDQVEIRIKDGSAYYCGLETCGNVWLCPVCSAKIHHRRAAELREALTTWEQQGHAASLITITIPHDLDDPLSRLVDTEGDAWNHVTAGAAWQRLKRRLGIAGHIVALEFTWGRRERLAPALPRPARPRPGPRCRRRTSQLAHQADWLRRNGCAAQMATSQLTPDSQGEAVYRHPVRELLYDALAGAHSSSSTARTALSDQPHRFRGDTDDPSRTPGRVVRCHRR